MDSGEGVGYLCVACMSRGYVCRSGWNGSLDGDSGERVLCILVLQELWERLGWQGRWLDAGELQGMCV